MKDIRFTFLCTAEDRKILMALAKHFGRSQSDTIRLLLRHCFTSISNSAAQAAATPDSSQDS